MVPQRAFLLEVRILMEKRCLQELARADKSGGAPLNNSKLEAGGWRLGSPRLEHSCWEWEGGQVSRQWEGGQVSSIKGGTGHALVQNKHGGGYYG